DSIRAVLLMSKLRNHRERGDQGGWRGRGSQRGEVLRAAGIALCMDVTMDYIREFDIRLDREMYYAGEVLAGHVLLDTVENFKLRCACDPAGGTE
ncbi:hypothetical protein J6590_094371, partial [Homalodisca vitripennis]